MAAGLLGELSIQLSADISRLIAGLNTASSAIKKFGSDIQAKVNIQLSGLTTNFQEAQIGAKFLGQTFDRYAIGAKKFGKTIEDIGTQVKDSASSIVIASPGVRILTSEFEKSASKIKETGLAAKRMGAEFLGASFDKYVIQSKNLGSTLEQSGNQVKNVANKIISASSGFGSFNAELSKTIPNTQESANALNRLSAGATQTQIGAKFLGSTFDRYVISVKQFGSTIAQTGAEVKEVTNKSVAASAGVQSFGSEVARSTPKVKEAANSLNIWKKGLFDTFGALPELIKRQLVFYTGAFAIFTAIGAIVGTVSRFIELEFQLARVAAILGLTTAEASKFRDIIRETVQTVPLSALEVNNLALILGKAGFNLEEVKNALVPLSQYMVITGESAKTVADVLVSSMAIWNFTAKDTTAIMNSIFTATERTKLEMGDLQTAFSLGGATLAGFNFTFNESLALLAALKEQGVKAGTSIRGLRGFMIDLLEPNRKFRMVLDQIGVRQEQVNPLMNNFGDILSLLKEKGFGVSQAYSVLEHNVAAVATAAVAGADDFKRLTESIGTGKTLTEGMIPVSQTLKFRLIDLKETALSFGGDIISVLGPALTFGIQKLNEMTLYLRFIGSYFKESIEIVGAFSGTIFQLGKILFSLVTMDFKEFKINIKSLAGATVDTLLEINTKYEKQREGIFKALGLVEQKAASDSIKMNEKRNKEQMERDREAYEQFLHNQDEEIRIVELQYETEKAERGDNLVDEQKYLERIVELNQAKLDRINKEEKIQGERHFTTLLALTKAAVELNKLPIKATEERIKIEESQLEGLRKLHKGDFDEERKRLNFLLKIRLKLLDDVKANEFSTAEDIQNQRKKIVDTLKALGEVDLEQSEMHSQVTKLRLENELKTSNNIFGIRIKNFEEEKRLIQETSRDKIKAEGLVGYVKEAEELRTKNKILDIDKEITETRISNIQDQIKIITERGEIERSRGTLTLDEERINAWLILQNRKELSQLTYKLYTGESTQFTEAKKEEMEAEKDFGMTSKNIFAGLKSIKIDYFNSIESRAKVFYKFWKSLFDSLGDSTKNFLADVVYKNRLANDELKKNREENLKDLQWNLEREQFALKIQRDAGELTEEKYYENLGDLAKRYNERRSEMERTYLEERKGANSAFATFLGALEQKSYEESVNFLFEGLKMFGQFLAEKLGLFVTAKAVEVGVSKTASESERSDAVSTAKTVVSANLTKGSSGLFASEVSSKGIIGLVTAAVALIALAALFKSFMDKIPKGAEGGLLTKRSIIEAGENGPELLIPLNKLKPLFAGIGGKQFVIAPGAFTFNVQRLTDEEIDRARVKLTDAVKRSFYEESIR